VCALAHHIEAAGIATVAIVLVREHAEAIRPPRGLWVPFELGRPFGPPNYPGFQRQVLETALGLLGAQSGPVLEDFPHDAPTVATGDGSWACPLPLPPRPEPETPADQFARRVADEVAALRPWYDESRRARARTMVATSGFEPEVAAAMLVAIANGELPDAPETARVPMPGLIRFAADDLKAFCVEAVTARPSSTLPGSADINRWLYGETAIGEALHRAREVLAARDDDRLKAQARFLVPGAFVRRRPQA
jgi:hypothetical protein